MTRHLPRIAKLRVEWATTRIDIPFIELSPSDYVLDYGLEVEIWPEDSERVGALNEYAPVDCRPNHVEQS